MPFKLNSNGDLVEVTPPAKLPASASARRKNIQPSEAAAARIQDMVTLPRSTAAVPSLMSPEDLLKEA